MSFNVIQPGGAGGGGANADGSNITSVATWRNNLGVASVAETKRLGFASGHPGICLDGISGTRVLGPIPAAPGTGDFSMWVRFGVPAANPSVAVNLIAVTLSAGYSNASNSAHVFIGTSGQLGFASGDGTNTVSGSSSGLVSAYAGQIADAVLTRKGTAWTLYLNGTSVATGTSTPGSINVSNAFLLVGGNYDSGTITFTGIIQRATYFNRTLSESDVASLVVDGIHPTDQWGATTSAYTTNFSATDDGWFAPQGTVTPNSTDPGAVTQTLKVDRTTGGDGPIAIAKGNAALVAYRRYRASAYVYNSNIATNNYFTFSSGTNGLPVAGTSVSQVASGTSGTVTGEFISLSTLDMRIGPAPSVDGLNTTAVPTGSIYYVKNITFTPCGAMVDLNFTVGIGSYFPDRSTNIAHGEGSGGITHIEPVVFGLMCVTKSYAHSDISATTGTTKMFDLPPKAGLIRVEVNRTAAMDASVTLGVGKSGNATFWVASMALSATGFLTTSSSGVGAQSETASTGVYLKKSASTTTGSVIVRAIYEIRG